MRTRHVILAALLGASPGASARAQAIDPDPRFWLEAGAYLPAAETQVAVSLPDSDNGTNISLEQDLGFRTRARSLDVTLGAKLDDDFLLEASLFDIDRRTTAALASAITVEDATY